MQVLKVLSDIWKSGAEMNLLDSGEIELKHHEKVPAEVMKAAEQVFPQIEEWFRSWKNASPVEITIRKALHLFMGWERNDKLNKWLCDDKESLFLLHDWTIVLAENGWKDIYVDYRQFENDKSREMAQTFYERAMAYAKGVATS